MSCPSRPLTIVGATAPPGWAVTAAPTSPNRVAKATSTDRAARPRLIRACSPHGPQRAVVRGDDAVAGDRQYGALVWPPRWRSSHPAGEAPGGPPQPPPTQEHCSALTATRWGAQSFSASLTRAASFDFDTALV